MKQTNNRSWPCLTLPAAKSPLTMNNSVSGNSLDEPIFAFNNNHSNRIHFAITGDWDMMAVIGGGQGYRDMKIEH